MAARVLPPRLGTPRSLAERLAMTGTEVERIEHHGVGALEQFVVGRCSRPASIPTPTGSACAWSTSATGQPSQIVCGAPNVAAGQTVAVAKPGAVMPDGTELGTAKLRGVESNGMILAEDELAIGTEHAGIIVLADDGWTAARHAADEVLPIATEVLELEITPNRPDCLGVYGVAREVHAATGAAAEAAAVGGGSRPAAAPGRGRQQVDGRVPRPLPALHRPRVRGRQDRPEPAVAEGAADGRRPAADLERRRHHQLRDAAHRPAAARVRPRPDRRRAA